MSRIKKLIERLLSKPKDFTYNELTKLLVHFGYSEKRTGSSSGSRVAFVNDKNRIIRLHKPHPKPIVKRYIIEYLIEELKKEGFL